MQLPGRSQRSAVVDLLNLFSGQSAVVNAEIIDRSRTELRLAGPRKKINGIIAKIVGVGGRREIPVGGLEHAVYIEVYLVAASLALVVDHGKMMPDPGRRLGIAIGGRAFVAAQGGANSVAGFVVRQKSRSRWLNPDNCCCPPAAHSRHLLCSSGLSRRLPSPPGCR